MCVCTAFEFACLALCNNSPIQNIATNLANSYDQPFEILLDLIAALMSLLSIVKLARYFYRCYINMLI